jgi:SAM-dependent methyltransferase
MGDTQEEFLSVGNQCASLLLDLGLQGDDSILDVGCGYGRLAFGLLNSLDFIGRYEGFDLQPRHIAWCREAITTRFSNFHFAHVDIANARYNPQGSVESPPVSRTP